MESFHYHDLSPEKRQRCRQLSIFSVYRNVVNNIRKVYKVPHKEVEDALAKLAKNKKVDSSKFEFYIANMIYYYSCYTELAFNHMLAFLNAKSEQINLPKNINIVSIGDGAGHDVIGFVTAACEKKLHLESVTITIIDMLLKWQLFFSVLISDIQEAGNISPLHTFLNDLDISYKFLQAQVGNCDRDTENSVKQALIKADIVIVFNILRHVGKKKEKAIIEVSILSHWNKCFIW